jgi:long-chain fatty acid transport protein
MRKTQLVLALAAIGFAGSAFASNGYFAHGYGMAAKGMGGAGIAFPQDTLAAATNPAGMVHLGNRMDFGMEIFAPDRGFGLDDGAIVDVNPPGSVNPGPPGASFNGNGSGAMESWFPIPEFGYNRMLSPNTSFGVSVYGNGGMNTTYADGDHPFNGGSGATVGIDLMQLFIAPTIAHKVNDQLSVGASINLIAAAFKSKGLEGLGQNSNGRDYSYGAGLHLGAMYKVSDVVTLGARYQSKANMSKFDDYDVMFPNSGEFDIPATYGLGIAIKATEKLDIAFDVNRIEYGKVAATGNSPDAFGTGAHGFGWDSQTVYKLGMAYKYSKDLTLRAGFNYGKNPVNVGSSNLGLAFNTLAPGIVEKHLTLGFTKNLGADTSITGYYLHAFKNKVDGTFMAPTGAPNVFFVAPGSLEMSQNAFGLSYNKKF